MAYVIGLTGGIGSGKTTISNLFEKLGVPIVDADIIARELTKKDQPAYQKIVTRFGENILLIDKNIDRQKLRKTIFENPVEKKWLEDLLHPLIRKRIQDDIKKINAPYCICVIPLLAESKHNYAFLDRILVVDAPIDTQLQRVKARDHNNDLLIQKILTSQAAREARLKIADDVLTNDTDIKALEKKVWTLHRKYSKHT